MSDRPTMLRVLAEMATALSQRSTCDRAHNGAIIFDDRGVMLSGGYNGALAGMPHCVHDCDCELNQDPSEPWFSHADSCLANRACEASVHAEANAIVWAARRGVATEGRNMVCTMSPCYRCSQLIIQAGIKEVRFISPYRDASGLQLMLDAGVKVSPVSSRMSMPTV